MDPEYAGSQVSLVSSINDLAEPQIDSVFLNSENPDSNASF